MSIIECRVRGSNELRCSAKIGKLQGMGDIWDALIVGGGVAGCAAGILLARKGLSVLILEKGGHPRHHIGESLLPASMPILEELGLSMEHMLRHYQPKYGARFCDSATHRSETFGFAGQQQAPPSFQVVRADFDAELKSLAISAGCRYQEQSEAVSWHIHGESSEVLTRSQQIFRARFLILASGRSKLSCFGAEAAGGERHISNRFGHLAIYNYFPPFPQAWEDERLYVTVHLVPDGWIWCIPLRDGSTSIGIVLKQTGVRPGLSPHEQFESTLMTCPSLWQRLNRAAALDQFRTAADYSYRTSVRYSRGWVKIGDAGGFLDPVFSSGVHLAVSSAQLAASAVHAYLQNGDMSPFAIFGREMDWAERIFEGFIDRFYHRDLVRQVFFADYRPAYMKAALTDVLAGRVWDRNNPVIAMFAPVRDVAPEKQL